MTFRKPSLASQTRARTPQRRTPSRVNRDRQRRSRLEKRRSLVENLETRQLLAGPELVGIQPNEGDLLNDGTVLQVSPRELVFQFDDDARLDPDTLGAIRITRSGEDGVFESASASSDIGTSGQALIEFRAIQTGSLGNGISVRFTSSNRPNSSAPIISVSGREVTISVNSNTFRQTSVGEVLSGVANNAEASALIEVIQVSGAALTKIDAAQVDGDVLVLSGANAAQAVTDFGSNGAVRARFVSQIPGADGRGIQLQFELRNFGGTANPVVVVTDQIIRIQLNSFAADPTTVADLMTAINTNPQASLLVEASVQEGDANTPIGNLATNYSPLTLSGVSDVVVNPGFVGLGDSTREVIFRFTEPLPDDTYQIDILGVGAFALRNDAGEAFQDGQNLTRRFSINLGTQVAAVVPEPVRRNPNGTLSPDTGKIEVHFNDDDLNPNTAQDPRFYQLIYTRDTANNTDDEIINPISVTYSSITNIATLDFGRPLSRIPDPLNTGAFLEGAARLRVGTREELPEAPQDISLLLNQNNLVEPGDSFDGSFDLNADPITPWQVHADRTSSARVTSEIFNPSIYGLDLPGPNVAGTREVRPEDIGRLDRTVPLDYVRGGPDNLDGITVIQYDFAPSYLGDDPSRPGFVDDTTYFNIISEQQKDRVREAIQLFSEYLGVTFVEVDGEPTSDTHFTFSVGDLYGGDPREFSGDGGVAVVIADKDGDGSSDLAVMDFQDFDESVDDQFGGEFFRGAMFAVGQLLGYGYANDLPQPVTQSTDFIFTPGTDNEPAYPSIADILHGQYLYRPESIDIDMYEFDVPVAGALTVETIVERLPDASLLDSHLRLYRADGQGSFVEIAQNGDYFSNDSLIRLRVSPGQYMIGVSAKGNDEYDPAIPGTGFGGLSEGEYELRVEFTPDTADFITDVTGVPLDGDADGRPGGEFDFWFEPADPNTTLFVDKAAVSVPGGQLGTVGNPYREIDQAIAAAQPGDTIRVVGNGGVDGLLETAADNFSYQIGFTSNGLPFEDGTTLNLPKDVNMIIDAGAVMKFSRARLGVGSVSPLIDLSNSSLQVLGTPTIVNSNGLPVRDAANAIIPGSVFFTSINDDSVGAGNVAQFTPDPEPGDWGGIDFRGDLDTADEQRRNRENEGVFLNHLQYADMRYGGGAVSIGGQQVVVSPIEMAITRATIINSRITLSADAAIAATPDTFAETRFTDNIFQVDDPFTPDYTRIGPEIHGNIVVGNSINGLFLRLSTRSGTELETVGKATRFDDTDIVHVLTENLVIDGSPGGPIIQSDAPSSFLIRPVPSATGNVPAGTYVYRLTNVSDDGLESAASQPTITVTLNQTGGIQLNQLPPTLQNSGFVSRRLYRATVDPITNLPGEFRLVQQLNASSTTFLDQAAAGSLLLNNNSEVLRSRLDASLVIDPGSVLKIDGARVEARFGANLKAEGSPSQPIVITGLEDQRYGGGGTYDTNDRGEFGQLDPGDWGGLYIGQGAKASLDNVVIAGGGGTTRIEGGFAAFNAIEVHQADLRLTNSRLEQNANGRLENDTQNGTRVGRDDNASGVVFVRASQPIVVDNDFLDSDSAALSFDVNSLSLNEVSDRGRSIGEIERIDTVGNSGPLIQDNSLTNNAVNGLFIRGGELTTEGVWDDVDLVHVVTETIEVPNQHIFGGLRLESDARGSLVVKFESGDEPAGLVVGGNLVGAGDQLRDISDRIGGALQIMGHPDFPVVLTTLADDASGAGFDINGIQQVDTNNDGVQDLAIEAQQAGGGFLRLPTGPEVNQGLTIDNDVDPNTPGFFESTPGDGNFIGGVNSNVTVQDVVSNQLLVNQNYIFNYSTYLIFGGGSVRLDQTNVTQAATLVADDVVESRGSFVGPGGTTNWVAQTYFLDGVATMFSSLAFDVPGGNPLGDIRVVSYLDEDIDIPDDDILFTTGTPGAPDFRAVTIDGARRVGFGHGGFYVDDGQNQINATFVGWAADQFNDLEAAIIAANPVFTVPGTIDQVDLPPTPDVNFGTVFGPNDVTTAFAWDVDPTTTTSTVTSFLELIRQDPAAAPPGSQIEAGLWSGVIIREAADDRNVAAFTENEPTRTTVFNSNSIPGQSQFLGEIAPREQDGDENRRLGFVVDGTISARNDADVYSFIAESGTEVWLDIDRTGLSLDSVIELIDANGLVLAANNDSILAENDPSAIYSDVRIDSDAAKPLSVIEQRVESQRISVSESVLDATGGEFTLSIVGSDDTVTIPLDVFLNDPAEAIRAALASEFQAELGDITATLKRRSERVVDANGGTLVTGDPFVVELQFDDRFFVGNQPATIQITAVGVTGAAVTTSVQTLLLDSQLQDVYSINDKDAGMRVRLPGETGTRNLYHVRVRSSNTPDPSDFQTLVFGDPARNIGIFDGLTQGSYQLQIRLQEADESPGTQVRLADIRYATNGLQIIGQPLHSPLIGEEHETTAPNDLFSEAQPLGYFGANNDLTALDVGPLQSDRLSKTIGGTIDSPTDVDWYRFEIRYDDLVDSPNFFSTIFDLDYASNFARADMAMHIFNAAGQLIFTSDDSNIADDLPGRASSNDTGDLSRGSAGNEDPFLGTVELSEGTYFMAISNATQIPEPLDQFFNAASANPLLRLEPIDSVTRIVDQTAFGPAVPQVPGQPQILFDDNSIEPYTIDDVVLFVNSGSTLFMVNPFTGESYGAVGNFIDVNTGAARDINDIALAANGEVFGYADYLNGVPGDNNWGYMRIDPGTAGVTQLLAGGGIQTRHDIVGDIGLILQVPSNDGLSVEAVTIRGFQNSEAGFLVANRPVDRRGAAGGLTYFQNLLYGFDETSGQINGGLSSLQEAFPGAGTTRLELGMLDTEPPVGATPRQLGIADATEVNAAGVGVAALVDGDAFTLDDATNTVTFELDQGFTLTANGGLIRDEDVVVVNNSVFEFNTGARLTLDQVAPGGLLEEGTTVTIAGSNNVQTTFEFIRTGQAATGNVPIALLDAQSQPLTADLVAVSLVNAINLNVADASAQAVGNEIVFGPLVGTIAANGAGVSVDGDNGVSNALAREVRIGDTADPEQVIAALAEAIRNAGIVVSSAGNQLAFPELEGNVGSTNVAEFTDGLDLSGTPGVAADNERIQLLPTDTAAVIARRISEAVEAAFANVSANPQGRSLQIVGADIIGTSANLTAGGVPTGGLIRGIELVDDDLFAISETGGLFRVPTSELLVTTQTPNTVGQYIPRSTDLLNIVQTQGVTFQGLRAGPASVEGEAFRDILFGITNTGDIYAFNTFGELQPVFADGRSVISTGIAGALGLDFSTLDYNLWHTTNRRGGDAGHSSSSSIAFNYEGNFASNHDGPFEQPVRIQNNLVANPRTDGTTVNGMQNFPAGVKGVLNSNLFSLEGYSAADDPTLYFNYFLNTDGVDSETNDLDLFAEDQDTLRVYVVTPDGVSHLMASNNAERGPFDKDDPLGRGPDDEFDDPAETGIYDDDVDIKVQQLFDNTGTWRQARIDLGDFAGRRDLKLRVEYSTGGTTLSNTDSLRAVIPSDLVNGAAFVVSGERFEVDLAPSVSLPSGLQLQAAYNNQAIGATITLDGQTYVLNDGTRPVGANEISIDLLASTVTGTTLSDLTATELATRVAEEIRQNPPPNRIEGAFGSNFLDIPSSSGTNDLIYEATPLSYSGGNVTIRGDGQIEGAPGTGVSDVDLYRINVSAGSVVEIDTDFAGGTVLGAIVRVFDVQGNELTTITDAFNDVTRFLPTSDGPILIGISARGNPDYDPRFVGTRPISVTLDYTFEVSIREPEAVFQQRNLVEFFGSRDLATNLSSLLLISGTEPLSGLPVTVSRSMTAEQVAAEVRRAIANRFANGVLDDIPLAGNSVRLPDLTLDDPGPFQNELDRYGEQFAGGVITGGRDNASEGVFLDDFIIGFAERGEMASNSNVVNGPFVQNGNPFVPLPPDPVSQLQTGSYQVEMRDASEYVNASVDPVNPPVFRQFDTNERLVDARSIVALPADQLVDGATFSINDGRSNVEFEFDLIESNTGFTPGRVQIPYTLEQVRPGSQRLDINGIPIPGTGIIEAQSATDVARSIVNAINREDVGLVLDVTALLSGGIDSVTDPRVNLFGNVIVVDQDGALAAVEETRLRGDENRHRDAQGMILVEGSRFLFNETYGINVNHDVIANVNGTDTPSALRYPRNLVELNVENLRPGVVITSNVFAYNGVGGLQIDGIDPTTNETFSDPVAYERVVNNTFIGGTITPGIQSPSGIFEGILFDQGLISFADRVVDYQPDGGGSPPTIIHQTPDTALGAPDCMGRGPEPADGNFSVSLGLGGSITLEFTDNLLTGSGDSQPDLVVFETGAIESVLVEISRDGISFFNVGILGGLTNQLDIDAFGFGPEDRFAFVRLTDLRQGDLTGAALGADIDAVGALSTVPVDRYTPGGVGINVTGNAAPTLINNILANSDVGINIATGNVGTVLGANSYYRNTDDLLGANIGRFSTVVSASEALFASATESVFVPAAGASIIDSSIDSLPERQSLTTVRNALNIPPSPVLAPELDVNGQLRIDDPNVEPPSGLGETVFKDRGASDRGDLTGPRVTLLRPFAPGIGLGAGQVNVFGDPPRSFEIQLVDGISPADVTPGTGVDDRTVTSGALVLFKDTLPLVEGIDYRFGYNPSTNTIRLTPIAGVWEPDSTYTVRFVDASDAIVATVNGVNYTDGDRLTIRDSNGDSTTFEYETGIAIDISPTLVGNAADGSTITVFDGDITKIFEFDTNGLVTLGIPVPIPAAGNAQQLAAALAEAINADPDLDFTARSGDARVQLVGGTPLSTAASNTGFITVSGEIGVGTGFGIGIPAFGSLPDPSVGDGQTFIVSRGAVTVVTFELDNDGLITTPGATPVEIDLNSSLDDIADAIVRAVGGAGLGLSPVNAGFGRVFLGGDATYSVDVSNSGLVQLGVAGEEPSVAIDIPFDQPDTEIVQIVRQAIDDAQLPGIETSIFDVRVFLEGTGGVTGVGAVDIITIKDEVGNPLQSNQVNGRTEVTVFIGTGQDYGDAPVPYQSLAESGGPRHMVDNTFSLGPTVDPDPDASLPNVDDDDGVTLPASFQAGFSSNVGIFINNQNGRTFFVDAWFDWDQDKVFESSELVRFGSVGSGRTVLFDNTLTTVAIPVPASAVNGETFARFRLSEVANLGPNGDVPLGTSAFGEIEDHRIFVSNNPFQNANNQFDVNLSNTVTPLDALQIINALARAGGVDSIPLDTPNVPAFLPPRPDVNGDAFASVGDANAILTELRRLSNSGASGEGEFAGASFVQAAPGVLASGVTALGDALIADTLRKTESSAVASQAPAETSEEIAEPVSKTSVFDSPESIQLDDLVETLAADSASQDVAESDSETSALDQLFAQL